MGEIIMESLNYINDFNDLNIDDLSLETPIGWSSTCFDETINYYIDCNSSFVETKNENDINNNNN
uniref:Conserved hypothetical plastid protein n=1 Tax=Gracilaria tenuistipitata var. liui TaxID=285951 RepID=Q6B8P3_GRATL|nr:conserved hypothetical plastid protein [Gracilaria tenuistipitata var. liui]AAT79742.1 conserved hypothetical plastid protein [Gracilaria tenuistipitata var. liui]